MNSFKSILIYLIILLISKVRDTVAVYCSYFDTTANQIKTNFCPQTCCLTASSIEESCCYSWTWLVILIAFGFPIAVGVVLMIALCLFYRKRRLNMTYPNGLVMYVDPRRFASQGMFPMPVPPPQYNTAEMARPTSGENNTSSSGEPPAYASISETNLAPKPSAARLKSESSGTIVSVRSRHESGSRKPKDLETSVDNTIVLVEDDEVKTSSDNELVTSQTSLPVCKDETNVDQTDEKN